MLLRNIFSWVTAASCVGAVAVNQSTAAVEDLVKRRIPQHASSFKFAIVNATGTLESTNDTYVVSSTDDDKIRVEGNSISALLSGLHAYLSSEANVDIWWFIGSQLDKAPSQLPGLSEPLTGSSIVPIRYHFNTVTTSYTSAFWSWEDWELQLDWMAVRGINLPLAWIGVEKIFLEVFKDIGFSTEEVLDFLSGPAFLAWNHFGNIQDSWGEEIPLSWIDDQFSLQKKILRRMVDLGMTPILPAFPGYVPRSIEQVHPDANVTNGSVWNDFKPQFTSDTFLDPFDPLFSKLQKNFIEKQKSYYGDITKYYTLDQYNENSPPSGDLEFLRNVTYNTWKSLKAADPDAVWVFQAWLFASDSDFWTEPRIKSFLSGVEEDSDMLILDLFAESEPQWQRAKSFFGKPWIWCQLHDYGHNMGMYGQIENITVNAIEAKKSADNLVGFGLTMEGQEGNEIVYDLLLDQAWQEKPIDTSEYFHDWVSARYGASRVDIPKSLYSAWELVRPTVYNNTNLTSNAVVKSIVELKPGLSGLTNKTLTHPTTLNYDTQDLVDAWKKMYEAGKKEPSLFSSAAYEYDLVDWTRQVLNNAFLPLYEELVETYNCTLNHTGHSHHSLKSQGKKISALLDTLDDVLATNKNFRLSTWIDSARATTDDPKVADFLEYQARNQITLWGPTGEITDYASKSWAGLVSSYYRPRWEMFVEYLENTPPAKYNQTAFDKKLLAFEKKWNAQITGKKKEDVSEKSLETVLRGLVKEWDHLL